MLVERFPYNMVKKKGGGMYERSTNSSKSKKRQTVHTPTKVPDSQRMGADRQRSRSRRKVSDTPPDPLSMAKSFGARCTDFPKRQMTQEGNS